MRVHAIAAIILSGLLLAGCEILGLAYVAVHGTVTGISHMAGGDTETPEEYHENIFHNVARYCSRAIEGDARARHALARFHERGRAGFPKSDIEAWKWYSLAFEAGMLNAVKPRNRLGAGMSVADIAEAQRRTAAWTPAEPCPPNTKDAETIGETTLPGSRL